MRGNAPREIVDILQEIRTKLDLRQVWHTDVVQRIFGSELTQMVIYKTENLRSRCIFVVSLCLFSVF